jgi:hypothetical protein
MPLGTLTSSSANPMTMFSKFFVMSTLMPLTRLVNMEFGSGISLILTVDWQNISWRFIGEARLS